MKIAEALLLRADLKKKLASLRERIAKNAVVQEGDKPHENPTKLMSEAVGVLKQLESLVFRINQTNSTAKLLDGRTLTQAIAHRDTLVAQHSLWHHAMANSHKEPDRYSRSEIKWVATVDVAGLQKQSEDIAKKIRELNVAVQSTNWDTDLVGEEG